MIAESLLESPLFVPSLVGAVLFFQALLLMTVLSLSKKVTRLSRKEAQREAPAVPELTEQREANSEQKQLFRLFLEENPARRELSKKEQFAAFRRWREEKGLNWKNPGASA